jgi:hypothetical protein
VHAAAAADFQIALFPHRYIKGHRRWQEAAPSASQDDVSPGVGSGDFKDSRAAAGRLRWRAIKQGGRQAACQVPGRAQ